MNNSAVSRNMVDQIMSTEGYIIPVAKQSQLKADLYFRAMVIRVESGKLILRDGLTLRYKVQTRTAPAPVDVVWNGGSETPVLAQPAS